MKTTVQTFREKGKPVTDALPGFTVVVAAQVEVRPSIPHHTQCMIASDDDFYLPENRERALEVIAALRSWCDGAEVEVRTGREMSDKEKNISLGTKQ